MSSKMSTGATVAVTVSAVILLLFALAFVSKVADRVSRGGGASSLLADQPDRIMYRVSGSTSYGSLTFQNEQGGTEQRAKVSVPWETSFTSKPGLFLYIAAQNNEDSGTIGCEILVNGRVVKQSVSHGAYVIASCSGSDFK